MSPPALRTSLDRRPGLLRARGLSVAAWAGRKETNEAAMKGSCIFLGLVAGVLLTIAPKPAAADCGACHDFDVKKSHTMAPLEKQRTAAIAQQADATLTVTGRLRKIFAIGGETTGWLLELDSPLLYQDKKLPSVELDPRGNDLRTLTPEPRKYSTAETPRSPRRPCFDLSIQEPNDPFLGPSEVSFVSPNEPF